MKLIFVKESWLRESEERLLQDEDIEDTSSHFGGKANSYRVPTSLSTNTQQVCAGRVRWSRQGCHLQPPIHVSTRQTPARDKTNGEARQGCHCEGSPPSSPGSVLFSIPEPPPTLTPLRHFTHTLRRKNPRKLRPPLIPGPAKPFEQRRNMLTIIGVLLWCFLATGSCGTKLKVCLWLLNVSVQAQA